MDTLNITYRGLEKNDTLDSLIREKAAKLEQVHNGLTTVIVALEKPNDIARSGNGYRMRVDMRLAGRDPIVVKETASEGEKDEAAETVVRKIFDRAWRVLRDVKEQQDGKRKAHPHQQVQGFVSKIFPDDDYGFIVTPNEDEIYFHRHAVANDRFDDLDVGTGVAFTVREPEEEEGAHASTVHPIQTPGGSQGSVARDL